MNDTPTRRFWQIHLSTAVVLMGVVGILLWANLRVNDDGVTSVTTSWSNTYSRMFSVGWPSQWFFQSRLIKRVLASDPQLSRESFPRYAPNPPSLETMLNEQETEDIRSSSINSSAIALNVEVGLLITLIVCVVSEFIIRSRERPKPPSAADKIRLE